MTDRPYITTRMGIQTLTVPVDTSPDRWPLLQADWPMTEAQWAQMHHVLAAMKRGLVEPYGQTLGRLAPAAVAAAYEDTFGYPPEGDVAE